MARQTAYSMINVVATVDRRPVIGLWDGDDAISVDRNADRGTGLIGADGAGIFSITADKSAAITLRLQHTSPTHRLLHQKLKQQQARGALFKGFSFSVKDLASGEGGASDRVFIQTAPSDGKGVNASVREWVLWAGEYVDEVPDNG